MVIFDVGRPRFDLVDLAHRHTDDADSVAGVQAHGGGEVGDDLVARCATARTGTRPRDSTATNTTASTTRSPRASKVPDHGDFGLMSSAQDEPRR